MTMPPRRFAGFVLRAIVVFLTAVHGAEAQGPIEQFQGTLLVVWGDPHPDLGSGGEVRYSLAMADGRVFPLQFPGAQTVSASDFGRPVVVSGRRIAGAATTPNVETTEVIEVDAVAPAPQANSVAPAAVLGTRRVIYLLVKYSDDIAVPHPPAFFSDLNNPPTPPPGALFPTTVNGFYAKTSWNQLSWLGDLGGVGGVGAPGGWLTLPNPKSYYAPCGWSSSCANLNALSAHAITLAKAEGISFTPYDNINFVLSNDLDCCAWGGGYSLDGKLYGATWEPPWGQETGTYVHELGHSIGLPHSGWVYYAYDSPWDMMSARRSASSMLCGSYFSANQGATRNLSCTEPGDGYIAPHKDVLGWIPPANTVVTNTTSGGTWTLEGGALALGSALKMIKICLPGLSCTGGSATYYTVEARVKALGGPSQFDNAIPGEGIIVHEVRMGRPAIGGPCYFNTQSGWAVPVDATPGDYNSSTCSFTGSTALYNAQWTPGQTYTNGFYGVSISVVSRSGSTFVVSVAPAPIDPPGAFSKTSPTSGATGLSTSVSLSWGLSPGATSYAYCYDTTNDAACSSWISTGTSRSVVVSGLASSTLFYWHVRAANAGGTTYANGGASVFWNFTTAGPAPGVFGKSSPGSGATGQPMSLLLGWGASSAANLYEYCYDTTNNSLCDSGWTSAGTSLNAVVSDLAPGTTYYWQVRAHNAIGTTLANGGTWWSFSTQVLVTVTTNPVGRAISVDGTPYVSPQTFGWAVGSAHVIATSTPQLAPGIRLVFSSWSDGGAISHSITTPSVNATYTATFSPFYQLTTGVSPSGGGSVGVTPSSSDGFYASGTTVELTATPNTGYRFSGWSGDVASASNPVVVTMAAPRSVTAAFSTNLVRDGDFNGSDAWSPFATPDSSYVVTRIVTPVLEGPLANGVLSFYRKPPPLGTTNEGGVFQETGLALPTLAPLRAQFSLANGTTVRKRISVALVDHDFSDVSVCTFWLPPLSPFRTYQMRTHTTQAWSNAAIYFYAEAAGIEENYVVDSVSLEYDPIGPNNRTDCVDPTPPVPPGGPDGPELLVNGDFTAGQAPWTTAGAMTTQVAGGVFEFVRPAGTPAGVVEQQTGQAVSGGEILTGQFELGNSSSVRKRVTVQVRDADASDLWACTFWLPPSHPLSAYAVRGVARQAWVTATLAVYPETVGLEEWIRFDNVTLRRTPGVAIVGTECLEPGAAPVLTTASGHPPTEAEVGFPFAATEILRPEVRGAAVPAGDDRVAASVRVDRPAAVSPVGPGQPIRGVATSPVMPDSSPSTAPPHRADDPARSAAQMVNAVPARPVDGAGLRVLAWRAWGESGVGARASAIDTSTAILREAAPIDLRGSAKAWLRFDSRLSGRASRAEVWARPVGGAWQVLDAVAASDDWLPTTVDMSVLVGEVVEVQFVVHAGGPAEGAQRDVWEIEHVRLDITP